QPTNESPDVMTPALLAVGHDIETRSLLVLDCQTYSIILSFAKAFRGYHPWSKQLDSWIGEP
ncbi:MAG: hypothetical protein DMG11_14380, partial [Acidobacteria bacterium]